jgi:putative ABC transport system permease protein
MNFSENFQIALRALAANKLRSGLTMLGIIIGVGAVVALMAIGNGATASITSQVQGIGANLVTVIAGSFQQGRNGPPGAEAPAILYYSDYQALARSMKNVSSIVPTFQSSFTVVYATDSATVSVMGTTPLFPRVRAYDIEYGRFFTENESAVKARVAVLGGQTAKDLFHGLNPVGRSIKINGVPFEVIGVFKIKGSGGFGNQDELVTVPLETGYEKLFGSTATINGKRRVTDISMSAANPEVVNDVMVQVERLMRREHDLKLSDDLDFTVFSQAAFLNVLGVITATLTTFLGFIGVISLFVGGIGVMNIMLVSVTERTREIGLRKAVGAKRRTILLQFLIETVMLTFIGGLLGIALGSLIAAGVTAANLIQAQVTFSSVLIAFTITALVGVIFGIYPAFRASRLRPIEALRYE